MAKIFIIPQTGKYDGQMLILDYVEHINHLSTSVIPQHPVESASRSIADHRYREATKISISGCVSDNWQTKATVLPVSVFQTYSFKLQKTLRKEVSNSLGSGSVTTHLVNDILDKQRVVELDEIEALVPNDEEEWIMRALTLSVLEEDVLDIAKEKAMGLSYEISNTFSLGREINTIAQAEEMLNHLDTNDTPVTIHSLYRTYPNMVMTSFQNESRSGASRGAYWVSLDFEQQLIATTVTNPINVSPKDSEEANDEDKRGRQSTPTVPITADVIKKAKTVWENQKKLVLEGDVPLTAQEEETSINGIAEQYVKAGGSNNERAADAAMNNTAKVILSAFNIQK